MKQLATAIALGLSLATITCNRQTIAPTSEPKTIVILGSLTGVGQEIVEEALAPLTAETGIQIVYEGTDAFATILPIRVQGGDPPDIALFPQPGLMADLAREGALVSLEDWIDQEAFSAAYAPDWLSLGSV
ncbi:MAG: extracellular solute-binding protein, partial [Cyanobacteria bacterium J06638_6]